jgi:hypothetical protein
MPKPDTDGLTNSEIVLLLNECMDALTFDDVWVALMEAWDDDDKEEAHARLDDIVNADEEDA